MNENEALGGENDSLMAKKENKKQHKSGKVKEPKGVVKLLNLAAVASPVQGKITIFKRNT